MLEAQRGCFQPRNSAQRRIPEGGLFSHLPCLWPQRPRGGFAGLPVLTPSRPLNTQYQLLL